MKLKGFKSLIFYTVDKKCNIIAAYKRATTIFLEIVA